MVGLGARSLESPVSFSRRGGRGGGEVIGIASQFLREGGGGGGEVIGISSQFLREGGRQGGSGPSDNTWSHPLLLSALGTSFLALTL